MKTDSKWEVKKLGEICNVIAGQSPDGKYYNNSGNGLPFYQGKKEFTDKHIGCPTVWTTKITKEAQKDDILMSVRAPVGPINFATENICIGRGLVAIRPINEKEFSNDYLFLFLISIQDKITGSAGAVFASINKKQIENVLVTVPPIDEQKRIIAKLDKLFENARKLEDIARKNLQNSKDIFNSVLNETFRNKADNRQTVKLYRWEVKKLGEVCNVIAGQSPDGKYYNNSGNGLPFYQGKKEFTDKHIGCPTVWTTKITKEAQKDDILMSVRAPVGPINFATENICIGRGLVAIRPINEKEFSNDYLFLFLISIQDKITGSAGAVFASINKKQIENVLVTVPPIDEQKRIIAKLNELSSRTKELEVIYQKKIDDLSKLKKSMLKQIFCH